MKLKLQRRILKKLIGRKLAARVLKSWVEDFVDEDTGEVVLLKETKFLLIEKQSLKNEHVE